MILDIMTDMVRQLADIPYRCPQCGGSSLPYTRLSELKDHFYKGHGSKSGKIYKQ